MLSEILEISSQIELDQKKIAELRAEIEDYQHDISRYELIISGDVDTEQVKKQFIADNPDIDTSLIEAVMETMFNSDMGKDFARRQIKSTRKIINLCYEQISSYERSLRIREEILKIKLETSKQNKVAIYIT